MPLVLHTKRCVHTGPHMILKCHEYGTHKKFHMNVTRMPRKFHRYSIHIPHIFYKNSRQIPPICHRNATKLKQQPILSYMLSKYHTNTYKWESTVTQLLHNELWDLCSISLAFLCNFCVIFVAFVCHLFGVCFAPVLYLRASCWAFVMDFLAFMMDFLAFVMAFLAFIWHWCGTYVAFETRLCLVFSHICVLLVCPFSWHVVIYMAFVRHIGWSWEVFVRIPVAFL